VKIYQTFAVTKKLSNFIFGINA